MTIYNESGVKIQVDVPSTYSTDKKQPHVKLICSEGTYNHVYLDDIGERNIFMTWNHFGKAVTNAIEFCLKYRDEIKDIYNGDRSSL